MKALSLLLFTAAYLTGQSCQLSELPLDGTVDGTLIETDCVVRDFVRGETSVMRADGWKLTVREARAFRFRLSSTEFDPYLYLLTDRLQLIARNNDSSGKDSEIFLQLPLGTYTVLPSMNAPGTGAYRLQVESQPIRSCQTNILNAGTPVEADLTDTDCRNLDLAPFLADAAPVDIYRMEFSNPSVLTVSMDSTAFDAFLSVHNESGMEIASNDDEGGGTNAKLLVSLDPGNYSIRASAVDAGTGVYRIHAEVEDRRTCSAMTLPLNESVRGELNSSDCRYLDLVTGSSIPALVDQYRIHLRDRAVVTVSLRSDVIDTVVLLLDSRGELVGFNDDSDSTTTDSKLIVSLRPGVYSIFATDFYGDTGAYDINVATSEVRTCTPSKLEAPGTIAAAIQTAGCRVMDVVSPSSDGSPAAVVELGVRSRSVVKLNATSTDFQPAIHLRDSATGSVLMVGQKPDELQSLMLAGAYTLMVTVRGGGRGDFTISGTTSEPATCPAEPLAVAIAGTGELAETDCAFKDIVAFNSVPLRADIWKVAIESARGLTVEVSSDAFAPVVFLLNESFAHLNYSVNSAERASLRLPWQARPGTYYLVVSSRSEAVGPYQVRLSPVSTGALQ